MDRIVYYNTNEGMYCYVCKKLEGRNLFYGVWYKSDALWYLSDDLRVDLNTYQQITQSTDAVCVEMDVLQVGSEPVGIKCSYCHEDVMTQVTYKNSSTTHLVALLFAVFFWWCCCCILPYVFKRWKNVEHHCPNCKRFLGVYTRKKLLNF